MVSSSFSPLRINYYDVRNVINVRLMKLSRRAVLDRVSAQIWIEELAKKGAKILFKVYEDGSFLISWVAQWQMKEAEEGRIDSTHKACKPFNDPKKDGYLLTIVVRSSITNKRLPVCFFVTDNEIIPTLHQWLSWLKDSFNLNVKRIMVDCSPTEFAAIREVSDNVDILLCHWHIKRAWETHIKRGVKISKSTYDTKLAEDRVRANLNSMMYSETPEASDLAHQLFLAENKEFEVFLAYFNKSYHNQLKTFYFGRSRSLHVDRLACLLSQVVALGYWQDTIKVANDFGGFRLTVNQEKKRRAAYCIDYDVACSMVE
ncbi:uncharacterized protein RHIMIDRAFT_243532 [Rhizopus microsporus ATCC 52813]|uniref:MULE transposase domain-containing protein n=1 Tax=Rhizopus microsporus ATCC 52813 TaxID=1340429 RepID=A0A2G4T9S6_RHIZD|nr:uncharacterized protein RHIMIDRAFT_243532 [Rhizopus microsporus ATCC 52813]PHZ17466.1 hypothetical protein RHIMIDRAFT_243532 [Rhizopus microsporus ATCC 52813]